MRKVAIKQIQNVFMRHPVYSLSVCNTYQSTMLCDNEQTMITLIARNLLCDQANSASSSQ